MDLFNPPKIFNYKHMTHNLDITTLDNPYIQVIWEDTPDNFTQERIKSVKQYFQKKYNTNNVNVINKVKTVDETSMQSVDVSINIMDKNYQNNLIKSHLKAKDIEKYLPEILAMDKAVENEILATTEQVAAFKKWYIKKIEFSNFLSYGDNQVLNFENYNGITTIESDPANFGGKTVLSVDLLMFLFFNTTTKTTKAEEIFNRFTDKNKVIVKGDIIIDGEEYIIVRSLERKKTKAGEWKVTTELDFFKKLSDGELQPFTGEQRKETEKFIKSSIGEQEDFLMTILTTGTNLEELLESKPTARGLVLSKFLGLDFIKKKEEVAKEFYSKYSKGMLSNLYNTETLKQEITNNLETIDTLNNQIIDANTKIVDVNDRLTKGKEYKDNLLKSKHTDIEQELIIMNPGTIETEIKSIIDNNSTIQKQINEVNVVEPSQFYHEDEHDKIKEQYNEKYKIKVKLETSISDIEKLQTSVKGGVKCEHCGIELMNAAITQSKIAELDNLKKSHKENEDAMAILTETEKSFVQLKKEFDQYERNKLIKSKYELTLESNELKKSKLDDKLKRYFDAQEKIKKNNEIDQQIIKANIRIDQLESEKKTYETILTTNNVTIKNLNEKIKTNNDYILKITEEFEKERIYKIYLEIYGKNGISKTIMKTMMPLINSEIQKLLQDSCYFNLEIRINDKNEVEFYMIDNSTGVEKLMSSGSGYEKTIACLALRAVLTKVNTLPSPNIIVMDEVFGKISNDNLDMVYEFFIKIKEYFEKIFLITHNPLISNWGDNIIKIKKKDNISTIN